MTKSILRKNTLLARRVNELLDMYALTYQECYNFYHQEKKNGNIKFVINAPENRTQLFFSRVNIPSNWGYHVGDRSAVIFTTPDVTFEEFSHEMGHVILGLSMSEKDIQDFVSYLNTLNLTIFPDWKSLWLCQQDPRLEDIAHNLGCSSNYSWSGHTLKPGPITIGRFHEVFANWFSLMTSWAHGDFDKKQKALINKIIKSLDPDHAIYSILHQLCRYVDRPVKKIVKE